MSYRENQFPTVNWDWNNHYPQRPEPPMPSFSDAFDNIFYVFVCIIVLSIIANIIRYICRRNERRGDAEVIYSQNYRTPTSVPVVAIISENSRHQIPNAYALSSSREWTPSAPQIPLPIQPSPETFRPSAPSIMADNTPKYDNPPNYDEAMGLMYSNQQQRVQNSNANETRSPPVETRSQPLVSSVHQPQNTYL